MLGMKRAKHIEQKTHPQKTSTVFSLSLCFFFGSLKKKTQILSNFIEASYD